MTVSNSDKDSHCSEAIDADLKQAIFIGLDETFIINRLTGQCVMPYEWRWDLWNCKLEECSLPGDAFPARDEMLDLHWA